MTDSLVDLKRLALAATPGPWKWDGDVCAYDHEQEAPWLINERGKKVLYGQIDCDNSWSAELIAALSPERVLAMIAVIEAAEAIDHEMFNGMTPSVGSANRLKRTLASLAVLEREQK